MTNESAEHTEHILSYGKLTAVWVGLLVLTVVTVAVTRVELGIWKVWAALAIASVKSGLVIAFFMHMKYEPRLFRIILFITLFTLAALIGSTFFDILYR